ncbi:hypothetical protein L1N85_22015 [Paenibacillus alkaliterrae]|uniref:hypothetical protein n=1 Tax=Paenibacillus alkaliterrae TaxID=320909 RepID=UPI001F2F5DA6|nr:hypothetical protein [Paenibacillus alkaliterrae]MCF2941065.1 hypothetical protein [Paenibacillus alkaliterrae]
MSRLADIIENHQNLDQLFAIIKHHGVNAEYISIALIQQFEQASENGDGGTEDKDTEDNKDYSQELIDDLKQFCARF